jgi:transposase
VSVNELLVISDDRWLAVGSWLRVVDPLRSGSAPSELALRRLFAAVVYVVVLDLAWDDLPQTFGVPPTKAERAFQQWTDGRMWQAIQQQGSGPSSAQRWAGQISALAMHRARLFADVPDEPAGELIVSGGRGVDRCEVEPVAPGGPARTASSCVQPAVNAGSASGLADAELVDISVRHPVRIWPTAEEYRMAREAMNRHPGSSSDLPVN